jgi:Zn-dependent protease with chaperone function
VEKLVTLMSGTSISNSGKGKSGVPSYDGSVEKLSEKNYPDLYNKFQALKARVEKETGETIPDVYVVSDAAMKGGYLSEKNSSKTSTQYNTGSRKVTIPLSGDEREAIVICKGVIDRLGANVTLGVIAHEMGHDVYNHSDRKKELDARQTEKFSDTSMKEMSALKQKNELQADDFAKKYGLGKEFAKYLKEFKTQHGDHGSDAHPKPSDRIKALEVQSVSDASNFTPTKGLPSLQQLTNTRSIT